MRHVSVVSRLKPQETTILITGVCNVYRRRHDSRLGATRVQRSFVGVHREFYFAAIVRDDKGRMEHGEGRVKCIEFFFFHDEENSVPLLGAPRFEHTVALCGPVHDDQKLRPGRELTDLVVTHEVAGGNARTERVEFAFCSR